MQGDLSTRNRTQKLKKAQPTQSISRRIEDREERAAKNKQIRSIGAKKKKKNCEILCIAKLKFKRSNPQNTRTATIVAFALTKD
jgi:hypothetical protein